VYEPVEKRGEILLGGGGEKKRIRLKTLKFCAQCSLGLGGGDEGGGVKGRDICRLLSMFLEEKTGEGSVLERGGCVKKFNKPRGGKSKDRSHNTSRIVFVQVIYKGGVTPSWEL